MNIDLEAAKALLDFGARIGPGFRADEQLAGAVAVHNILEVRGVAYLADEVGMGKTYVALGALALFRHYQPDFRVLVIAPRENIQRKWMKEWRNIVANNVRFSDLRVRSIDRRPTRALVECGSLLELAHEAIVDPDRDFFARLTSFSVPLPTEPGEWQRRHDAIRERLPWLPDAPFRLRGKDQFKDNLARAICCALPEFDLVIIDEAHNLKHGFSARVAARNRALALTLGRRTDRAAERQFSGYAPRARRVLFLSATPIEETYRQIWNQLDVVGKTDGFEILQHDHADDPALAKRQKDVLRTFLVRRVTTMRVAGEERTKNEYRREWRNGGVRVHDEPLVVDDDRKRLIVALVQKKVAELLGTAKFNASYQIGMLASFESFLETAKVKHTADVDEESGNFDDPDQTDDPTEREGIDVHAVNRLARHYRETFGREMPHPKMDELVDSLASAWSTGQKALVFVRRVASVTELKRKLDERYDHWLFDRLRRELPEGAQSLLERSLRRYREEKAAADAKRAHGRAREANDDSPADAQERSGTDTFFAWFFRGTRAADVVSGAVVKERFTSQGASYATFFEDNHVAWLLECEPGAVCETLATRLGLDVDELSREIRQRATRYLSRVKRHARGDQVRAAQAAALELLKETESLGDLATRARVVWRARYEAKPKQHARDEVDIVDHLEEPTFFTELRRPEHADLRNAIWPEVVPASSSIEDWRQAFVKRELRAQMLGAAARLGHAFIDLYVLTIRRLGTIEKGAREDDGDARSGQHRARMSEYLRLLDEQRAQPADERPWRAFAELAAISDHFDLIVDVNAPELQDPSLHESATLMGRLFRDQDPVGGMSGQVNRTLVQQFRMPGYPLVLITTDVLQEGEDLHTFCSSIHHYGISWTPSSMEQRIGRIDRVRSETDRRLAALASPPRGDELLQVYYPHLADTVEVLQVDRVLERMNKFLRLMHEGLSHNVREENTVHVARDILLRRRVVPISGTLRTAFPVPAEAIRGERKELAVGPELVQRVCERIARLRDASKLVHYAIQWESDAPVGSLIGTAILPNGRRQPFMLLLRSDGPALTIRAISPVGRVRFEDGISTLEASVHALGARVGAIVGDEARSYDLTVEEDVMLGALEHDVARVGALLRRVLEQADALERDHLDGADHPIAAFRAQLEKETTDEG